jgi:hypothetical protein
VGVKPAAVLVAALKHGALLLVLGILAAQDTTLGATWGQRVDKRMQQLGVSKELVDKFHEQHK